MQVDLDRVGIRKLEPVFYISTGYGCIAGSPIISFGFYDCDPLLQDLNEEFRGWRYSDTEIVNLLRHEIGHAFCYAYKLYRTPEFRNLFEVQGNFFNTYPLSDQYDYNPWSRAYVNPCGDHYAQKHPDEDFAETFCVWLTPRSGWRRKYKSRPIALKKLEYVDDIVKQLGRQQPLVETKLSWMYERVEDIKLTVAQFMQAKPSRYYHRATGYVDPDLKAIFRPQPRIANRRALYRDYLRAENFLREQKLSLVNRISYWVGVDTTVVYDLIDKCIHRAKSLNLWLEREQYDKKLVELTSYITALCVHYRETGLYMPKER
ncbi:MAG: putative zinc-binding metallopeptidase [Chloroflexi bacterium]|nr:putative zinc-binding metallopeptidase [Chloroflexota bacterium]